MLPHLRKTIPKKTKKFKPGKPFNPNFDGNLLAWYDGDTLATDPANTWSDRSANGYDLTLFNSPSIINNAINGHDALQFDGINQYAQNNNVGFVRNQPTTLYFVFKIITDPAGSNSISDGSGLFTNLIQMISGNGEFRNYAGLYGSSINTLPLNSYGIVTNTFNGANSELRLNLNAALIGNVGLLNAIGLTLGSNAALGENSNIEIAYKIIRQGADSTATQNIFINFLKNRFGL